MPESPMVLEALERARRGGARGAIDFLGSQPAAAAAADAWSQVVVELYWRHRSLAAAVEVGLAGIDFALQQAAAAGGADAARQLKSQAKSMAYNVASYTWPGWDEPGIEIGDKQRATGRWAAELNLRLAEELGRGDVARSRAHWLIGAVQLADRHVRAAAASFGRAASLAAQAGAEPEARLSEAYRALAERLERPSDASRIEAYDEARSHLAAAEGGAELVGQIDTAWRVFAGASAA